MTDWSKELEADLDWRQAELASLKLLVTDSAKGGTRERALLRALWALLYAHYEGFCKFAWDFYLDHLERTRCVRGDCCVPIARFSLAKRFRNLRGTNNDEPLWLALTSEFELWMKDTLTFEERLKTNSNLWPDLLRGNSSEIGLPYAMVDKHELKLHTLVNRRNAIAHGKKVIVARLDDYQPYEDAALLAMHELAVAVLERLEHKSYLRA